MAFLSIHSSPLGRAGVKDTGGMSTYLRGLALALAEAGHQVDLFTRTAHSDRAGVQELGPNVRLVTIDDGLGCLEKQQIYPHCKTIAASIENICRQETGHYDFIFSHYWLSGCVGKFLGRNWQIPHLVMFHTLGKAKNEACPGENEPRVRLENEEKLARTCDRIIVAAKQEKEKIQTYFALSPEKIATIPCGIDRALFKPNNPHEQSSRGKQKIILSVGRIEPVKGFDLLLNAAALLPAEDHYKVVIVGGDELSSSPAARMKETAAELGLSGKVHFAGVVEHELLPLYYNSADVTVVPSYYESFGLVAMESIACGTPVVAAPVGVLPELISSDDDDSFGCLVNDRSPADWAAKIRERYLKPKQINQAEIDARFASYNWTEAASRLEELLYSRCDK